MDDVLGNCEHSPHALGCSGCQAESCVCCAPMLRCENTIPTHPCAACDHHCISMQPLASTAAPLPLLPQGRIWRPPTRGCSRSRAAASPLTARQPSSGGLLLLAAALRLLAMFSIRGADVLNWQILCSSTVRLFAGSPARLDHGHSKFATMPNCCCVQARRYGHPEVRGCGCAGGSGAAGSSAGRRSAHPSDPHAAVTYGS